MVLKNRKSLILGFVIGLTTTFVICNIFTLDHNHPHFLKTKRYCLNYAIRNDYFVRFKNTREYLDILNNLDDYINKAESGYLQDNGVFTTMLWKASIAVGNLDQIQRALKVCGGDGELDVIILEDLALRCRYANWEITKLFLNPINYDMCSGLLTQLANAGYKIRWCIYSELIPFILDSCPDDDMKLFAAECIAMYADEKTQIDKAISFINRYDKDEAFKEIAIGNILRVRGNSSWIIKKLDGSNRSGISDEEAR